MTGHLSITTYSTVMNAVFINFILFPSRKIFIFNSTNSDLSSRPPNCFCSIYEFHLHISILNTHMFCKYQNVKKNRAVPTKGFLELTSLVSFKKPSGISLSYQGGETPTGIHRQSTKQGTHLHTKR
jgi:hypothetical protein